MNSSFSSETRTTHSAHQGREHEKIGHADEGVHYGTPPAPAGRIVLVSDTIQCEVSRVYKHIYPAVCNSLSRTSTTANDCL